MAERFIVEFQDYLKKSGLKGIHFVAGSDKIELRPTLFNHKIAADLLLLAAASLGVWAMEGKDYLLISLVYCALAAMLWIDFNSINTIIIDRVGKKAILKSRNIFIHFFRKYILRQETQIDLNAVASFDVRENESFRPGFRRFFIVIKDKEKRKKTIFGLSKEEPALRTANFLNHLAIH